MLPHKNNMMSDNASLRQKKVSEDIAHKAGEFIAREASPQSLITVTRANISPNLKNVTIFVSVLPKDKTDEAMRFLKRQRTYFHNYLKEKTVLRNVPTVDFQLDIGEINRQQVDKALREDA